MDGNDTQGMSGAQYFADALEKNERGNFTEALTSLDRAMLSLKLEGSKDLVLVFSARALIMRRIAKETNDDEFLISAKKEVETGVEIARKGNYPQQLSTLLFEYGKVMFDFKNYEEALKLYQEALNSLPNIGQFKKSVEANFRSNIETTKLFLGDLTAEERATTAISEIKSAGDATDHELYVWMAGGYLRLAQAFLGKDTAKFQAYISEAEGIIDIDPVDLKLIKGDLDRLKSKIQSTSFPSQS